MHKVRHVDYFMPDLDHDPLNKLTDNFVRLQLGNKELTK